MLNPALLAKCRASLLGDGGDGGIISDGGIFSDGGILGLIKQLLLKSSNCVILKS